MRDSDLDESIFITDQMRAIAKSGDIRDIIISTVEKHMSAGGFDKALRARTGAQLQPRGR